MKMDARFYFANLGADVARCISAAQAGDEQRYQDSLDRAHRTLGFLRDANRPEAYEEGILMVRGVAEAKNEGSLLAFGENVNKLSSQYVQMA